MLEWGGLTMAWKCLTPNMPRFDTAVVPPWYSSGLSLRFRARRARSLASSAITDSVFSSAERITGVMRPPGIDTAMPTSECRCFSMALSVQVTLASGTRCRASARALTTKSLTDTLKAGLPSLSLGAEAFTCSRSAIKASRSQSAVR